MRLARHPDGMAVTVASTPAAASIGVANLINGPPATGMLLGATSGAAWLGFGGHLVVLSGPGSARLPNGVSTTDFVDILPQAHGDWVVGKGSLLLANRELKVVRWWNPRPSLQSVPDWFLAYKASEANALIACGDYQELASSIRGGDVEALRRSARGLLGRGKGLTPDGDDVLIGILAGLQLLGPFADKQRSSILLAALEPIVFIEASFRTTALSASLLRHAAAGEVSGPVESLLQALTGRGDLSQAVAEIEAMGATSGRATACGVLLVAEALTGGAVL